MDLGWDSFKWRNHQPDIGRFFNVDPLSEKYVYNSVYAFSENQVIAHVELEGLEKKSIVNSFKEVGKRLVDPKSYEEVKQGFKELGGKISDSGTAIGDWIGRKYDDGIIMYCDDCQTESTSHLRRGSGNAAGISSDLIEYLNLAMKEKNIKSNKPDMSSKTGKKDGPPFQEIAKSKTKGDKDLDATGKSIKKSKGEGETEEPEDEKDNQTQAPSNDSTLILKGSGPNMRIEIWRKD